MLIGLFRLLSKLPLRSLHVMGAALGWIVYGLSPSYRKRLQENISIAGYGAVLHRAIVESGKSILELPFIWCANPQRVLSKVRMENWDTLSPLFEDGKGVIFLTPHLGCFEIIAQMIASKIPLTALYRPPRKAILKPLLEGARARHNLFLAPANLSGVRTLLKVLKKGGAVGLLPDQVPQHGEGIWTDFFGKPAYTMTLPAKMWEITEASIVLTYAERLPRGEGFLIRFSILDNPSSETIASQTHAINQAMEQLIAHCPAQYFWSYNRYKTPPGVKTPVLDGESA